jgi:putative transposase
LARDVTPEDLALITLIDLLRMKSPVAGSRMLRCLLAAKGNKVGRHGKTLMRRRGIDALYRKPPTTTKPGHKIYPYRPRDLMVMRPNQAWAMEITDIPMAKGFVHLAAVLECFSRCALS